MLAVQEVLELAQPFAQLLAGFPLPHAFRPSRARCRRVVV